MPLYYSNVVDLAFHHSLLRCGMLDFTLENASGKALEFFGKWDKGSRERCLH